MYFKSIIFLLLLAFSFVGYTQTTYQEEFVFLNQQLKTLKKRRQSTIRDLKHIESDLKTQVFQLEKTVSQLNSQNEVLETKLKVFDEERLNKDQIKSEIENIKYQMSEEAKKRGGTSESFEDSLDFLVSYIEKGDRVYLQEGAAFLESGEKIKSEILNLGHIASFIKVNEDDFKPLAPGREDKEALYAAGPVVSANKIKKSMNSLQLLDVSFKDGQRVSQSTWYEFVKTKLNEGGLIGLVILILGLVGLFIGVLRFIFIKPFEEYNEEAVKEIVEHIQNGDLKKAKGRLGTTYKSKLTDFIDYLLNNQQEDSKVYESRVIQRITDVQKKVNRFGPYLLVLAGVAPLLGLLGTVTGMIETFGMITTHGTGDPKVLSGGIKAALVTTQFGLIVAIPCILLGNYLSARASRALQKFEEVASCIPKKDVH